MYIKLIAKSWKAVISIILINFLIVVAVATTIVKREFKHMSSIDTTTMLKIKVKDIQKVIDFTLKSAVENLSITKKSGVDKVSVYFEEFNYDKLADLRKPIGMEIGVYYKKMIAGKKVLKLVFGSDFTERVPFKGGKSNFIAAIDSAQKQCQHLKKSDNSFKGYAYSNSELEILKSYIPLLTVLHQETIYSTSKALAALRQIAPWGSEIQTDLLKVLHESQSLVRIGRVSWPLSFVDYILLNHGAAVYWINSLHLGLTIFIWLIVANLLLITWLHLYRRSFWELLSEELPKQGLSLNFPTLCALAKSNLKLILLPRKVQIIKHALREECLKLKEKRERENIRKKAISVFQEIKDSLSLTDSHFGVIENYYNVAMDSEINVDRSWRNLIKLERQLRNMHLRCQECSSPRVQKKSSAMIKSQRSSRRGDLIADLVGLLPSTCQLNFSNWSENNINCLSRALIILPSIHEEAVLRLLGRKDLKNLMLRRDPFMMAIETANVDTLLTRLNINVEKKQKREERLQLDYSQLLQGIQVVIIGTGRAVNKKERFREALADLGARSTKFIDAKKLTKVKSAAKAAKNHDDTLIVLMQNHISHKVSWEMNNVHKVIYVHNIAAKQFKGEIIEAYSLLEKKQS